MTTNTATYTLDLREGWVIRQPADAPASDTHDVVPLRRDTERMRLLDVEQLEVGLPMRLILTGLHPVEGVLTIRETTPVLAIAEVAP